MDSQHRHELKENELQSFFLHFGEFWEKRGRHISLILLVVIIGITVWVMKSNRDWQTKENAWTQLDNAATATDSLEVAEHGTGDLRHQALLQAGDQWLASALSPADEKTADSQALQYKEARPIYEKIVDDPNAKPIYQLNAMLGLACVEENEHNWAKADSLYTQIISLANEQELTAIADLAIKRQEGLTTLKRPVIFGKEPEPVAQKLLDSQDIPAAIGPGQVENSIQADDTSKNSQTQGQGQAVQ